MIPAEKVQRMYADYSSGMSLGAVARKHGHERRGLNEIFVRRGLKLRPCLSILKRKRLNGRLLPDPRKTPKEIAALIARATRIAVPPELNHEWRLWSMDRRRAFIDRLRRKLNLPGGRPQGPFSANVTPFEYGSPEAIAIEEQLNVGRNSRTKRCKIKPNSQGVIWKGKLFFWNQDGYFHWGAWNRTGGRSGRPMLHHLIWEEANGRKVPPFQTVIVQDGNKNNLAPANLALRSMADCARLNRCRSRMKESRELTAMLLKNHQQKRSHDHLTHIETIRARRSHKSARLGKAA